MSTLTRTATRIDCTESSPGQGEHHQLRQESESPWLLHCQGRISSCIRLGVAQPPVQGNGAAPGAWPGRSRIMIAVTRRGGPAPCAAHLPGRAAKRT